MSFQTCLKRRGKEGEGLQSRNVSKSCSQERCRCLGSRCGLLNFSFFGCTGSPLNCFHVHDQHSLASEIHQRCISVCIFLSPCCGHFRDGRTQRCDCFHFLAMVSLPISRKWCRHFGNRCRSLTVLRRVLFFCETVFDVPGVIVVTLRVPRCAAHCAISGKMCLYVLNVWCFDNMFTRAVKRTCVLNARCP